MGVFKAGIYGLCSGVFSMFAVTAFLRGDYGSLAGQSLISSGFAYESVQAFRLKPGGAGKGLVAAGFALEGLDKIAEQGYVTPIATIDFLIAGLFGVDYLSSRE